MHRIRKEQMDAFRRDLRRRFIDRAAKAARIRFPDTCAHLDDGELRATVERGVESAGQYGLTTEWDVSRYVFVMLRLGEGFTEEPQYAWAKNLLEDPFLAAEGKTDLLCQQANVTFEEA